MSPLEALADEAEVLAEETTSLLSRPPVRPQGILSGLSLEYATGAHHSYIALANGS